MRRSPLLNIVRFASRKALREAGATSGFSRGAQVAEIQRRVAEYDRMSGINASETSTDLYSSGSIMGDRMLKQDSRFEAIRSRLEETHIENPRPSVSKVEYSYPLAAKNIEAQLTTGNSETVQDEPNRSIDRGFYVDGDMYVDEYVAGSTADIPDDEITLPSRIVFGSDDAVEHIDFQLPGQSTSLDTSKELDYSNSEWTENEGTIDPERPASKHKCAGCAAPFHCKDSSLPGFLPVELLDKLDRKKADFSSLCRRCHLLKHHNFLLNVNVCQADYKTMMSQLKMKQEALILLVVDVTDLPGSIHSQLPQIIGSGKPMIVIGNKVDLLPPDAKVGYYKRFRTIVQDAIESAGFRQHFNILHTGLVSAKTGYGVEDLITEIHLKWTNVKLGMRNDMYLVGCTNAGKSTLFNAFLQSDLCKVRAMDLVERATTSPWPGTTISLLKFPVMKPSPYRLEVRRRRLLTQKVWLQKEMYARKLLLQETGDSKYAVSTGIIQNSYKEQEDELQPVRIKEIVGEEETKKKRKWVEDDPIFAKGSWCFDTPGTVNHNQVLSLFTLDELIEVLPRRLLMPRTALVPVGHSLLIGGVARIDVLSTRFEHAVYLTTFASEKLPLNVLPTIEVDKFMQRNIELGTLVVPKGDNTRLSSWPGLKSQEFGTKGYKGVKEIGSCDFVFSSIGWTMLTTRDREMKLSIWSPDGKGLAQRQPILPYSATLRGKRIPGTQFYKVKPIEFPVNVRRIQAEKNKRKFSK